MEMINFVRKHKEKEGEGIMNLLMKWLQSVSVSDFFIKLQIAYFA